MSDETGVVIQENNVITRQEEKSLTERLFGEFDKVFVSGRAVQWTSEFEVVTRFRIRRI